MYWALNDTLLSLFRFLLLKLLNNGGFFSGTNISWVVGWFCPMCPGIWQYSLTHFGTLWGSLHLCNFFQRLKLWKLYILLKYFEIPYPDWNLRSWSDTWKWLQYDLVFIIEIVKCLRLQSSQCCILHIRLPAIWDFHFVCAVLSVLLCLNRWKSWSRREFRSTMQEPLLITATHCCYFALSEDQGSVFIMSLVYILWYFQSVSAELRLT